MEKERGQVGRPRSEHARVAVLRAVDDLLLEVGYRAMTMKNIAERAGVARMTVYRWWSTKAEILFEASAADAEDELALVPSGPPSDALAAYLTALVQFLAHSPAGIAYRALLGEAQHDSAVAGLLASKDVLGDSARAAIGYVLPPGATAMTMEEATATLIGPVFFWIMSGRDPAGLDPRELAEAFLREIHARDTRSRAAQSGGPQ